MQNFLQNFVLIQLRTSPLKICKILHSFANLANSSASFRLPRRLRHVRVRPDAGWSAEAERGGLRELGAGSAGPADGALAVPVDHRHRLPVG